MGKVCPEGVKKRKSDRSEGCPVAVAVAFRFSDHSLSEKMSRWTCVLLAVVLCSSVCSCPYHEYEEKNLCSCQLFVGDTVVYQTANASQWYSCSGWGLYRCGQFCENLLFQDEFMRLRSRQNACDTLGTEIYTQWYHRRQVCNVYEDVLAPETLCCRRGRPADDCGREDYDYETDEK